MKYFEDLLWAQQDKTESSKDWSCEKVVEWVTTIEGMHDVIGTTLLDYKVNGDSLLVVGREDLKAIGVTQFGPFALMLGEITNL